MSYVERYERGDVARFTTVFRNDDGESIQPDSTNGEHDVTIEITRLATGETVVSETQMTELSETEFEYRWQTTEDMAKGEYAVEMRGEFSKDTVLNRDRVKLVDVRKTDQGQ